MLPTCCVIFCAERVHRDGVAQDLRDREHADHRGDEVDALHQLDRAEGEARKPAAGSMPIAPISEPEEQRDDALQRILGGDEDRAGEAERGEPEILEGREVDRELGERRRRDDQDHDPEQPADDREDEVDAEFRSS